MRNLLQKKVTTAIIMAFLTTGISHTVDSSRLFSFLEFKHYDLFQNCVDRHDTKLNTVIVSIDDKTLLSLKDEPFVFWGPHFAKAIEVLNARGAEAVGLDFLFTISAESWLKKAGISADNISRTYDIPFRNQLGSGTVVLASLFSYSDDHRMERILPPFDYWAMMPGLMNDVGIANLSYDSDGVCRSFDARFEFMNQPNFSFSYALAMKYFERLGNIEKIGSLKKLSDTGIGTLIGFAGPPATFKRISFKKLLEDNAMESRELEILKGKIAIITEENSGNQDLHRTPYELDFPGFTPEMMTGAEIHANIVESLVSGKYPVHADPVLQTVLIFFLLFMLAFILQILPPMHGCIVSVIAATLYILLSYKLFSNYMILQSAGFETGTILLFLISFALRYSGSEANRKKIIELFGRYVSDDVVDKLVKNGVTPGLGGSLYEVTVLFSDIRDFTAISEILNPEETVEFLNEYFGRICTVILDYGGTIDKFIGDAVMAVFGAPVQINDHAFKALSAALKMTEIASDFNNWINHRFIGKPLPEFRIGIGLHTGMALIGNIGSPRRIEYTAIGDTVNTASRIEGITKELGWSLAVSKDVIDSIKNNSNDLFDFFCIGSCIDTLLKGKTESVTLYEVEHRLKMDD